MTTSDWTEQRFTMLQELNDKGSNSWIAREINRATGSVFSRSAIISKRHRSGLPCPGKTCRSGEQIPRQPRRLKSASKRRFVFGARGNVEMILEPAAYEPVTPRADFLGIPLLRLKDGQCRYPDDSEPYLFCGQPVQKDSSYCPQCHARCWKTPAKYTEKGIKSFSEFVSAA